jgi:hypothetical protein
VASESSSIDPGERLGWRRVRAVATATGRSGQLCLHWPCMFCRLGGRPLLDANCPFATTIISNVESRWTRPGWTGPGAVQRPWTYPRLACGHITRGKGRGWRGADGGREGGNRGQGWCINRSTLNGATVLQLLHNRVKTTTDREPKAIPTDRTIM